MSKHPKCFGLLWNPRIEDCRGCADFEECGEEYARKHPEGDGGKKEDATDCTLRMVPVEDIEFRTGARTHLEKEALDQLKASIETVGLSQPITVLPADEKGVHVGVIGWRRWNAFKQLGRAEIPCMVCSGKWAQDSEEMLAAQIVENVQRADLNPIELAEAYRDLMEKGHMSQGEVADRVGVSRGSVNRTLSILKLEAEAKEIAQAEGLGVSKMREIGRAKADEQKKLTKGAGKKTREQLAEETEKTAEHKRVQRVWKYDTPEFRVIVQFKGGRKMIVNKVAEALDLARDQVKRAMQEKEELE